MLTTRRIELVASLAERFLPVIVILVAIILRLHNLESVPLGLLGDEAYNGLDAQRIVDGERPIFLVGNHGREALFMYLQAVSISLLGSTSLALRMVSAILGILTVLAAFFLTKRMFGRRVALLASGWLTISLWHVIFSRTGWRAISLPFFLTMGFYCVWRGLQEVKSQGRKRDPSLLLSPRPAIWFALGGAMIGLSLHTYSTARFAPLVIVALAVYLALLHRHLFVNAVPGLVLAFIVTILVFLPQGLFFLSHPESFVERARGVTIVNPDLHEGNPGKAIFDSALRTLGMFAIRGDAVVDKNIPGRPLFDPLSALLALFGLALTVRRLRQPVYGFLMIWLVVMLAPSFLAIDGTPNYFRITGLIPALFMLPALGAASVWEAWDSRLAVCQTGALGILRAFPVFLVTLAFLGGAYHTYQSYFAFWAHSLETFRSFSVDRLGGSRCCTQDG